MKLLIAQVLILISYIQRSTETFDSSNYHEQEAEHREHAKKPIIPIIKHSFELHDRGYQYSYETGNGIHSQETGFIKNKGDEKHETLVQQGTITYHDEHGQPITLTYKADENGFQPQGKHLPTPPPIPEEIQKALNNQEDKQQIEVQEEPQYYLQQEQPVQSYEHQQEHHYQ